jgi:hypothetical protein
MIGDHQDTLSGHPALVDAQVQVKPLKPREESVGPAGQAALGQTSGV